MDIFFFVLKETYYAHFYNIYASGVPSEVCLWSFSWKYPTDNLLYHFENAYFEWKQKRAIFMHVSLNVNEMLFNDGCGFTDTLLKNNICLVLIIIFIVLKSCILNHIRFLIAHIRSERTVSGCHMASEY